MIQYVRGQTLRASSARWNWSTNLAPASRGGASRAVAIANRSRAPRTPRRRNSPLYLADTQCRDTLRNEDDPPPMTRHGQLDLFGESQPELPGDDETASVYRADPDEVRAELLRVLAKVRAAQSFHGMRAARSTGAPFSADDRMTRLRSCVLSSRRKSDGWKRPEPSLGLVPQSLGDRPLTVPLPALRGRRPRRSRWIFSASLSCGAA
jgi:hypothetical protein